VVEGVKKGDLITPENVRSIRPGYGLHPKYYNEILGKTFSSDIEIGQPLSLDMISK
jgi:pseudaminic acid synthase